MREKRRKPYLIPVAETVWIEIQNPLLTWSPNQNPDAGDSAPKAQPLFFDEKGRETAPPRNV